MKKTVIIGLLKYGLGFGLLGYVVWSNWNVQTDDGLEVGLAGALQRPFKPLDFSWAAFVCLASVLLTYVRWYVLVRAQNLPFTLGSAMRLGMVGSYFNTFLPGSVGGDILKAAFIAREQSRRTVAVATVVIDRVIGLCGLIWIVALVGGIFWASESLPGMAISDAGVAVLEAILFGALLLAAGSVVVWILTGLMPTETANAWAERLDRVPRIGGSLAELWRAVWLYRRRGKSVALTLVMAMVGHLGFVLCFFLGSLSINPADAIPTLSAHFLIVPVGMAIQAGFPSPGGVGGGEFGYGKLYELVGFPKVNGVLASLVQRLIYWVLGIAFYIVYLRMKPQLPAKVESV
ncbi:MAG: flippase-like domain-containing protein [Planctomycetes bacterium]|nr:flippase-like domain-containing protein [Planctomycetota bacterium]